MKLILMGDVNLMDVTNPAEPFRKILGELHAADVVLILPDLFLWDAVFVEAIRSEVRYFDHSISSGERDVTVTLTSLHCQTSCHGRNGGGFGGPSPSPPTARQRRR